MWIIPVLLLMILTLINFGRSAARFIGRSKSNEIQCRERKFYPILNSVPAALLVLFIAVCVIMNAMKISILL